MRLNAWKTNPTLDRRSLVSLFSDSRPRSCPASQTDPEVGRSRPAAQCSRVLRVERERNGVQADPDEVCAK
jgi:hypothetical protein